MITYVDTSTLLKLVVEEPGSERASTIWTSADAVASVALIVVEVRAALAAARRGRRLTAHLAHQRQLPPPDPGVAAMRLQPPRTRAGDHGAPALAEQSRDGGKCYAHPVTQLLLGALVAEHLRLVRLLGRGAMGSVWLADHLSLQAQVAVKFMSPAMA